MDAVPVKRRLHALHVILDVDNNFVILAHLNAGPGYHSISS